VTSGQDQNVVAFTRDASTGALTWLATYHSTNDVAPLEGLNHPQSLALDSLGKYVYVGAHRDVGVVPQGTVVTLSRDDAPLSPTFGQLTWISMAVNSQLNDPLSLVVSGDDKHVYVASNETNAVVVFESTFGVLSFVEAQSNAGAASGLTETWGVAIDGLGKYVYATGRTANGLAVFARNAADGKLTFVEAHLSPKNAPADPTLLNGMGAPRRLAVAPDGLSLYVPGDAPGSLTGFSIDTCGNSNRGIDEECDDGGTFCISCKLVVCGSTPLTGCTTVHTTSPGNAALAIKNDPTKLDTKDSMSWQWKKGNVPIAGFVTAFGHPLTTADYVVCVYDDSANTQPLASRAIPKGGAEWTQKIDAVTLLPKQFKYKSKSLRPDGIQSMTLTAGAPDKASIKIKGKGAFLRPPALAPLVPGPAGLDMPVTVVVRNTENTECWVAEYDGIIGVDPKRISKNDETQFKGKSN
jgi:6-phosphogluconolactonase (cycloisomerase 2 family)